MKRTKESVQTMTKDNPFIEDISKLSGEAMQMRFINIERVLDYRWERNPKAHDLGGIYRSIEKNGFRDFPAWDKNLINLGGVEGAFVYGNGRIEALHWAWRLKEIHEGRMKASDKVEEAQAKDYPPPKGILFDDDGVWYIPCMFGLDSDSQADAEAFGVDHNILTATGGDLGIKELMSMFDQSALADIMGDVLSNESEFITLDGHDFEGLQQYLAKPAFDSGNAQDGVGTDGESGGQTVTPPSAIRMVQLFFNEVTIKEFADNVAIAKTFFGLEDLTDVVLAAVALAAKEAKEDYVD